MRRERVTPARPATEGRWLIEWPTRVAPLVDLICIPGAGAGASAFRTWRGVLPPFAAVFACQLPGREERMGEAPPESLATAADAIAAEFLARGGARRPFVMFGHSMGGTLVFEVASRLLAKGHAAFALAVAASTPPTGRHQVALSPDALRALMMDYDPKNECITGNDELYAALAPVILNDIAMLWSHEVRTHALPSEVRMHLMSGMSDGVVPAAAVRRWVRHFAGSLVEHEMPGGHFFPFRESSDDVTKILSVLLRDAIDQWGRK